MKQKHGRLGTEDLTGADEQERPDRGRDEGAQVPRQPRGEGRTPDPRRAAYEEDVGQRPDAGDAGTAAQDVEDQRGAELFAEKEIADFRGRWRDLQATFVDDPRQAVQDADELVAQVMQTMAATFAEHKQSLENQWQRGDEVATEDLRVAIRRYRVFFEQLVNA